MHQSTKPVGISRCQIAPCQVDLIVLC